jgi:hypothetical protein
MSCGVSKDTTNILLYDNQSNTYYCISCPPILYRLRLKLFLLFIHLILYVMRLPFIKQELAEFLRIILLDYAGDIAIIKCVNSNDQYFDIVANPKFLAKQLGLGIPTKNTDLPAPPTFEEVSGETAAKRKERLEQFNNAVKDYAELPEVKAEKQRSTAATQQLVEFNKIVQATNPLYLVSYSENIAGTTGYQIEGTTAIIPHTKTFNALSSLEDTTERQKQAFTASYLGAYGIATSGKDIMQDIAATKANNMNALRELATSKFKPSMARIMPKVPGKPVVDETSDDEIPVVEHNEN